MKYIFREYLFTKGILVAPEMPSEKTTDEDRFCVLVTLVNRFGIQVQSGLELLSKDILKDAVSMLGKYVPEPFYRGFPDSVRRLTNDQLLFDQLYHYFRTYGMNNFEGPSGHSILEEVTKVAFTEKPDLKLFRIISEREAKDILIENCELLLCGNRPLSPYLTDILLEAYKTYVIELPKDIPCKKTVIALLYETKNVELCRYLKLSDVVKILEYIQYHVYCSENLKKLNLRNQDRKLLIRSLDYLLGDSERQEKEIAVCFEKRQIWKGLLHHLHYHPKNLFGKCFVNSIRNAKMNYSAYAIFESYMASGNTGAAAEHLCEEKGPSEVVRHMNYILSRCGDDEKKIQEVLSCLE